MNICACIVPFTSIYKIMFVYYFYYYFKGAHLRKYPLIIFLERKEGKERNINWLPLYMSGLGVKPTISVCALTGNQIHNLLVYGTMLQSTEPSVRVIAFKLHRD